MIDLAEIKKITAEAEVSNAAKEEKEEKKRIEEVESENPKQIEKIEQEIRETAARGQRSINYVMNHYDPKFLGKLFVKLAGHYNGLGFKTEVLVEKCKAVEDPDFSGYGGKLTVTW